ncbi:MAG: LysM peptidoglycan-binding domain-containing protein [Gaiellaceae bacterium]
MFVSRLMLVGVVSLTLLVFALGAARPSSGAAPETRYVVQAGDTLWRIAAEHTGGDVREAVWRLTEENDLTSPLLQPGQVLVISG